MLNFKHLHYFWVVAKQGSISDASKRLHITPQTISGQISLLEQHLGSPLLEKAGRGLALTDTGRLVARMADDIFALGQDLEQAARRHSSRLQTQLRVGVTDVVPKSLACHLLAPAMSGETRLVCRESNLRELLAELAVNRLDFILADAEIPEGLGVKGHAHFLGDTGIAFLASETLISVESPGFPACLDQLPLLLPSPANLLQSRLLQWFETVGVQPKVVGEFDDSALMKAFGQTGKGVFIAPNAIALQIARQHQARILGVCQQVREPFYLITPSKQVSNELRALIVDARAWLRAENEQTLRG